MKMPLVSILCVSYNHERFIRSCLESLVSQECDFDFEILIHDDASTDTTQTIIKEFQQKYPEIVKPILQTENQWSKKAGGINLRFNYPRAQGKYIALCDGDDFWIGKDKLQKQVNFLETHKQYSIICGAYVMIDDEEEKQVLRSEWVSKEKEDAEGFQFDLKDLSRAWMIRPSTALFRNITENANLINEYKLFFDIHLFYHLLKIGKGYYSKKTLAGYNRHKGGVFSSKSSQELVLVYYHILKEIYQKNQDEVIRELYLKICGRLIKLKISCLISSRKLNIPELKQRELNIKTLYKEGKSLIKTNDELKRFYKNFIPLQVKIINQKVKKFFRM